MPVSYVVVVVFFSFETLFFVPHHIFREKKEAFFCSALLTGGQHRYKRLITLAIRSEWNQKLMEKEIIIRYVQAVDMMRYHSIPFHSVRSSATNTHDDDGWMMRMHRIFIYKYKRYIIIIITVCLPLSYSYIDSCCCCCSGSLYLIQFDRVLCPSVWLCMRSSWFSHDFIQLDCWTFVLKCAFCEILLFAVCAFGHSSMNNIWTLSRMKINTDLKVIT